MLITGRSIAWACETWSNRIDWVFERVWHGPHSEAMQWTVANTCDWNALNGCQTSGDAVFDLNYQPVPQEACGAAPRGWVCAWNTNRGFTGDRWVSAGGETGGSCGTWRHSCSSFFNLQNMILPPPTHHPSGQALMGQTTLKTTVALRACV